MGGSCTRWIGIFLVCLALFWPGAGYPDEPIGVALAARVKVTAGPLKFNRKTGLHEIKLAFVNRSKPKAPVYGPLSVQASRLGADVNLADATGQGQQGPWLTVLPSGQQLNARKPLKNVVLRFSNPGRKKLKPRFAAYGLLAPNGAPTAAGGADRTVPLGAVVALDGSASTDPDGHPLNYRWSLVEQPAASLAALGAAEGATAAFTADVPGTYRAQLVVSDRIVDSAPAVVAITVPSPGDPAPANQPPLADAGAHRTVDGGTPATLDGGASRDPDGRIASYFWEQTAGPAVALSNPASANPSFTAPAVAQATDLGFRLTVTDDRGATASAVVTIRVVPGASGQAVISGKAIDEPVAGGNVVIQDLNGNPLGSGTTDADGGFSVEVSEAALAGGYRILVSGGQSGGEAFEGELAALYSAAEPRNTANATLLTTLVAEFAKTQSAGTPLANRDAAIGRLVDIGMILQPGEWSSLAPPSVDLSALRNAAHGSDGLAGWLARMLADLGDGDVSPAMMAGFPQAHGGIVQINLPGVDNATLSINRGDPLNAKLVVLGKEGAAHAWSVLSAPPGFEVAANGGLHYTVPDTATPGEPIPFEVRAINTETGKGRNFSGHIHPMPGTVIAAATVAPGAGTQDVASEDNAVVVKVPREGLAEPVKVEVTQDLDADGNPTTSIRFDKKFEGVVEIALPELNAPAPAAAAFGVQRMAASAAAFSATAAAGYPLSGSLLSEEKYFHKVFCTEAVDRVGNRVNGRKIFIDLGTLTACRSLAGIFLISTKHKAWELKSECANSDSECFNGKTPVLFVHGYSPSVFGLGGGENTWEHFPRAVKNMDPNIRVFEFRWITAARFEDVAADLGKAIAEIHGRTGRKVHIVAHSFGGILARTYLQGLATGRSYANDVASLITVGSPHSGLFDADKAAHGVSFKQGQDGQAQSGALLRGTSQIDLCQQLSCYQMGEYVGFSQAELKLFRLDVPDSENYTLDVPDSMSLSDKPGKFISVLSKMATHKLPKDLPVQVLLGLSIPREDAGSLKGVFDLVDEGDGLIAQAGQRIAPALANQAYLNRDSRYGGIVTEKVLGLDADSKPGASYAAPDRYARTRSAYGYRHSSLPVGPILSVPEVRVNTPCAKDGSGRPKSWDCWDETTHHAVLAVKDWIGASNDADNDGMPDAWERTYGLNPNDPADAALDADGDGVSNRQEYRNGTNPVQIEGLPGAASASPATSTWTTSPQSIAISAGNAQRIYCTLRTTLDGREPAEPPEPTVESHDPCAPGVDYIAGNAGQFQVFAAAGQNKRIKARFRGWNANGYGAASGSYRYALNVSGGGVGGTGKLNDTGITRCGDYAYRTGGGTGGWGEVPAFAAAVSGSGTHNNDLDCNGVDPQGDPIPPGQDTEHGRDALAAVAALVKVGGGHAGFDFTKIDRNGNGLPASATDWACVRDV